MSLPIITLFYFLIFNTMRKLLALSALFALLGLTSCGFGGGSDEPTPDVDGEEVDTQVNSDDVTPEPEPEPEPTPEPEPDM